MKLLEKCSKLMLRETKMWKYDVIILQFIELKTLLGIFYSLWITAHKISVEARQVFSL